MIEFHGNLDAVNELLDGMAARLHDTGPAMRDIGRAVVESTRFRFRDGKGPDGKAWPKSGRALREGGQTLVDSGRLRESITARTSKDSVRIGTNVAYAVYHQLGAKSDPHVIRPRRKKALFWPGASHPVAKVNHPGSVIPARPFLGLDDGDESEIHDIVLHYLEGN